jgi:glycosyltransferase involved in cell wall biosynthesis
MANATAIILKGYPRLSETFIAQEIRALEKQGLPVLIVSLRHPTDKSVHPIHNEITAPVNYLPEYVYQEIGRVWRAWRIVRRWPNYKSAFSAWWADFKRNPSPNRARRFAQALVLALELPDDVKRLHAHFLHTPSSVTRYASLLLGIPWTGSAHAVDIYTTPGWEIKEKLDSAEWIATCTKANRDYLRQYTNDRGKVELIYHGIDLTRFPQGERTESQRNGQNPEDPVRILSVGRAVEKKGYLDLLASLAMLPKDLNWHFIHVGGGPLSSRMKSMAKQWGLGDRIDWYGALPQEDVLARYNEADIFVQASRIAENGDRDGLPNVLMEAQSQGLACISTKVSAIPELIVDGETGLLAEPGDIPEIAAHLEDLIRHPERRAEFGDKGRERVSGEFDFSTCVKKVFLKFGLSRPGDVEKVA